MTLSSDYLKQVSDKVNVVRKRAVDDEFGSATKMMKYYNTIINKAKGQLDELKGLKNAHPERAIMDLGAKFKASSFWDKNWNNPRLDSATGIHVN